MKLIFEKSVAGRSCSILPDCDVAAVTPARVRKTPLRLPELSENDISRHYTEMAKHTHGVNDGFYPLGSCTMKYNPKINEEAAGRQDFCGIHPLQPVHTVQGCLTVLSLAEKYLCEITGMDSMTFQPAAGAQGELTGLMLIKKYHEACKDEKRTKIIIPDSAHGTNPATAAMVGMTAVNIPSGPEGCVDLDALRGAMGDDVAGMMLTNPNTLGIFEKDILAITEIVHGAGGLVYYDGANLNAIMGIVRPGDMGFDCVHLNLHKTFSTPHGGGGPGSGAVGCKAFLAPYLPKPWVIEAGDGYTLDFSGEESIGRVKNFYGNFLVVLKALTYIMTLGSAGIKEASQNAVLNANYLMKGLSACYDMAYPGSCMHEFVMTLSRLKKEQGVSALDVAKALLDEGIHPPTMYFPLIVPEALMVEPTETESKEMLDEAIDIFTKIYHKALEEPQVLKDAPLTTAVSRPDEAGAARYPKLKYDFS